MKRVWSAASAMALTVAAVVGAQARPAAARHDDLQLWVTIAVNAAGEDRIAVFDYSVGSTDYASLASGVATALGLPPGSFRSIGGGGGARVVLDEKLARPDGRGRLSYALDSGKLQVLAARDGYKSVVIEVCTPKVRQVINALVAPGNSASVSPTSRCRGWFRAVGESPIRARLELSPDRQRYPAAMGRAAGVAAVAFGLLGIGATLLRRGPLRRRSVVSWLLSAASALSVGPVGWGVVSLALWLSGTAADPVLIGGGSVRDQVARTLLPGLVFVVPALLPGAVLLSVPRRQRMRRPPPVTPTMPALSTWWPTAWWSQWAAQGSPGAPPGPAAGPSDWVPPGTS